MVSDYDKNDTKFNKENLNAPISLKLSAMMKTK